MSSPISGARSNRISANYPTIDSGFIRGPPDEGQIPTSTKDPLIGEHPCGRWDTFRLAPARAGFVIRSFVAKHLIRSHQGVNARMKLRGDPQLVTWIGFRRFGRGKRRGRIALSVEFAGL